MFRSINHTSGEWRRKTESVCKWIVLFLIEASYGSQHTARTQLPHPPYVLMYGRRRQAGVRWRCARATPPHPPSLPYPLAPCRLCLGFRRARVEGGATGSIHPARPSTRRHTVFLFLSGRLSLSLSFSLPTPFSLSFSLSLNIYSTPPTHKNTRAKTADTGSESSARAPSALIR